MWRGGKTAPYYLNTDRDIWFLFRSNGNTVCDVRTMFESTSFSGTLTYDLYVNNVLKGTVGKDGTLAQSVPLSITFGPGLNVLRLTCSIAHRFSAVKITTQSVAAVTARAPVAQPGRFSISRSSGAMYRICFPVKAAYRVTVATLGGRVVQEFGASGDGYSSSMGAMPAGIYTVTAASGERSVHVRLMW
jgi:hypothetical protein